MKLKIAFLSLIFTTLPDNVHSWVSDDDDAVALLPKAPVGSEPAATNGNEPVAKVDNPTPSRIRNLKNPILDQICWILSLDPFCLSEANTLKAVEMLIGKFDCIKQTPADVLKLIKAVVNEQLAKFKTVEELVKALALVDRYNIEQEIQGLMHQLNVNPTSNLYVGEKLLPKDAALKLCQNMLEDELRLNITSKNWILTKIVFCLYFKNNPKENFPDIKTMVNYAQKIYGDETMGLAYQACTQPEFVEKLDYNQQTRCLAEIDLLIEKHSKAFASNLELFEYLVKLNVLDMLFKSQQEINRLTLQISEKENLLSSPDLTENKTKMEQEIGHLKYSLEIAQKIMIDSDNWRPFLSLIFQALRLLGATIEYDRINQ